jgi:tetratricopeptide (TPR) repeat protein
MALPAGALSRETSLLLIDVTMRLNQYDQAKSLCLQFLNNTTGNVPEFKRALSLLGQIYSQLNEHDKAALAYVGVFDKLGGNGTGS